MWPKNSQTVTRISHPLFPRSLGPFTVKLFTLYAIRNNAHAFPRYIDVDQRTGAHDASMRRRAALPARELRSSADFERCSGDARRGGDLGAFGNAVATASFQTLADSLVIDSVTELQHNATAWPVFDVAATAVFYPFRYSDDDWIDLGALAIQQYPDPAGRLRDWARAFVGGNPTDTLALLKDLSSGISGWISYQSREDEGTQSPIHTLDRGWGSCRDFAVLFVEAARSLGFGARIVSGYLHNSGCLLYTSPSPRDGLLSR